jgi:hypothetical protein
LLRKKVTRSGCRSLEPQAFGYVGGWKAVSPARPGVEVGTAGASLEASNAVHR